MNLFKLITLNIVDPNEFYRNHVGRLSLDGSSIAQSDQDFVDLQMCDEEICIYRDDSGRQMNDTLGSELKEKTFKNRKVKEFISEIKEQISLDSILIQKQQEELKEYRKKIKKLEFLYRIDKKKLSRFFNRRNKELNKQNQPEKTVPDIVKNQLKPRQKSSIQNINKKVDRARKSRFDEPMKSFSRKQPSLSKSPERSPIRKNEMSLNKLIDIPGISELFVDDKLKLQQKLAITDQGRLGFIELKQMQKEQYKEAQDHTNMRKFVNGIKRDFNERQDGLMTYRTVLQKPDVNETGYIQTARTRYSGMRTTRNLGKHEESMFDRTRKSKKQLEDYGDMTRRTGD